MPLQTRGNFDRRKNPAGAAADHLEIGRYPNFRVFSVFRGQMDRHLSRCYHPSLKLPLTRKTALTIANAMNPTSTNTSRSTPLAITLVKTFN